MRFRQPNTLTLRKQQGYGMQRRTKQKNGKLKIKCNNMRQKMKTNSTQIGLNERTVKKQKHSIIQK
jgi:hypothetical protein